MFHREQKTNFRVSEFSLSGGFLQQLLQRPEFGTYDIGELFEFIADSLYHTVGVMTDRVDFTLINVCSPFTRYSHGSAIEPPMAAWPRGKALIFTFAIGPVKTYENQFFRYRDVRHNSNSLTKWGLDNDCNDFVSISIDMVQAADWHLEGMRANQLQYVYNMIGAMTKNFMRRQLQYLTVDKSYDDIHEVRSIRDWYVELYSLPIKQVFTSVPVHLWVFNYHIWEQAPNLIPMRTITPVVAMYYFMYLHSSTQPNAPYVLKKRLGYTDDGGIADYLAASIMRMVQDIRTPGDRQVSTLERLAPAVMETFLRTGSTQLEETGLGYLISQEAARRRLIVDMQTREYDVGKLFLPAKPVAIDLMRQEKYFRETINRAMEYPQITL